MYTILANIVSAIRKNSVVQNSKKKEDISSTHIDLALQTLQQIDLLMPDDDTSNNWRRSFSKIKETLTSMPNKKGIEAAKTIWNNMHGGMGSWNDYYIPHQDHSVTVRLNEELQKNCALLTEIFERTA